MHTASLDFKVLFGGTVPWYKEWPAPTNGITRKLDPEPSGVHKVSVVQWIFDAIRDQLPSVLPAFCRHQKRQHRLRGNNWSSGTRMAKDISSNCYLGPKNLAGLAPRERGLTFLRSTDRLCRLSDLSDLAAHLHRILHPP